MAEKRMFTMKICDSDAFLDMPLTAQALYFHLCMRADDDGFISSPKRIVRLIRANDDDFKLLLAKRFLLGFESGVIVIKHWRMHNAIRADRYRPTDCQEELSTLAIKPNKAYTDHPGDNLLPAGGQLVATASTAWLPDGCHAVDNASDTRETDGCHVVASPVDTRLPDGMTSGDDSAPPDIGLGLGIGLVEEKGKEKNKNAREPRDVVSVFSAFAAPDVVLMDTLVEFARMRKTAKKPMTARAAELLCRTLERDFPREQWIPALEQSIQHCWLTVYPLRSSPPEPPASAGYYPAL